MLPSVTLSTVSSNSVSYGEDDLLKNSEQRLGESVTQAAVTTAKAVVTTAAPPTSDSAVVAVVIILILLTVAALAFLLYRYLCHSKGAYRTTGEQAPGEDPDYEAGSPTAAEKKEYFI